MPSLIREYNLDIIAVGDFTSSIQFGFIIGTLLFAVFSIADRFSPSKVFFVSACIAAISNVAISISGIELHTMLILRFFTGFFLAGIYPVGMKIASDYFKEDLGKSLGFLVGALVLGTSFPHLLNSFDENISPNVIIRLTSVLSIIGGIIIYFGVPDGPFRSKGVGLKLNTFWNFVKFKSCRRAAFGYFGHMWELYSFWTMVPVILYVAGTETFSDSQVSKWSFLIIGAGTLGCIVGGFYALKWGARRVAITSLVVSGLCCIISPFLIEYNLSITLIFLLIWGFFVVMDSPVLSTLVAKNADPKWRGTALTIVNCIGFSITIISIQFLQFLSEIVELKWIFIFLALGPIFGILHIWRLDHEDKSS